MGPRKVDATARLSQHAPSPYFAHFNVVRRKNNKKSSKRKKTLAISRQKQYTLGNEQLSFFPRRRVF